MRKTRTNKPAEANPAIASRLDSEHYWPGVSGTFGGVAMRGIDSTFLVGCVALPSFFWLRGVWRDRASDHLNLMFAAVALNCTTWPLNIAGIFVIILGVLTMLAGPLDKRMSFRRAADFGVGCILVGFLLAMLI